MPQNTNSLEQTFKGKKKSEYYINPVECSISKLNHKGQKQTLTYNDLTSMFLDFSGINLTEDQKTFIKEYLVRHRMTTFMFCTYPKDHFPPEMTVEQIVEKMSKHNGKLLQTYAASILFLQTEGLNYDQLLEMTRKELSKKPEDPANENWEKLPETLRIALTSYYEFYENMGQTEFMYFPQVEWKDFLRINKAIFRNSASVEQTLKLFDINPDEPLYDKTTDIWTNYLQGKNSKLSWKEAFPILNLTCTYSVYKINFKDKNFEQLIKNNIDFWKNKLGKKYDDKSTQSRVLEEPNGLKLIKSIIAEKVSTNVGLTANKSIQDYLINQFDLKNYIENEDEEKEKFVQWFMKNENSTNREMWTISVSELVKHNIEHSINKAAWLVDNYGKELQSKVAMPQELQKFCSTSLARTINTPRIHEQIKLMIANRKDDNLEKEINILKFFHLLNKNAIKTFKDSDSKQLNLPDIFARYFMNFTNYFSGHADKAQLQEVSQYFVELMNRRDELPGWVLRGAFDNLHRDYRGNIDIRDLKDNIHQLEKIKEFLTYSDSQLNQQAFDHNKDSSPIDKYYEALSKNKLDPKSLVYIEGTDYDVYKFFKSLDLNKKDPEYEHKLQQLIGKYIIQSTGLKHDINKLRTYKNIKNITSEDLSDCSRMANCIKNNSFSKLLEEKESLAKSVYTHLLQTKEGLSGEDLAKKAFSLKRAEVDKKFQTIYEDDHYSCFIPTFDDIREWAQKMGNCMANCYLPNVENGEGIFLYICKKGQYGVPLNATYLVVPSGSGYGYYGHRREADSCAAQIAKNIKFNKSTTDKKSKNFGKPKKKIFEGLEVNECKNNGGEMCGQPAIYDLVAHNGKRIQSEREREQLYDFCCALRDKFGFDGSHYFADFDRKMEDYVKTKKQKVAQKIH